MRDWFVLRRGGCYNLFRWHGPPHNLFQDGQVRVTKLFCACCLPQRPQNEIVTNPGRTRDSRMQAWKLPSPSDPKRSPAIPSDPKRCQVIPSDPRRPQAIPSDPQAIPGDPRRSHAISSDPQRSQAIPGRAPGDPKRSQAIPSGPRRAQAIPSHPKGSQAIAGDPKRSQAIPSDPRRSQAKPGVTLGVPGTASCRHGRILGERCVLHFHSEGAFGVSFCTFCTNFHPFWGQGFHLEARP